MTGQVQPASIAALLPGLIAPAIKTSIVDVVIFVFSFFIAE
jgi:hypothetical protein